MDAHNKQMPRSTGRPDPDRNSGEWVTRTGDRLQIRPIRPEDESKMIVFHEKLSDLSVRMRYFGGLFCQHRTSHDRLARVCAVEDLELALVAEVLDEGNRCGEIVGVGRLVRNASGNSGEFALVVIDDFQRRGVGAELLRQLIHVARKESWQRSRAG